MLLFKIQKDLADAKRPPKRRGPNEEILVSETSSNFVPSVKSSQHGHINPLYLKDYSNAKPVQRQSFARAKRSVGYDYGPSRPQPLLEPLTFQAYDQGDDQPRNVRSSLNTIS